jgi:hypothetical protein
MSPKKDFNKRMRFRETEKARKNKTNLIINNVEIREIMDESGEVQDDTIIQLSFQGILINLSIAAAMKMTTELSKVLNIR